MSSKDISNNDQQNDKVYIILDNLDNKVDKKPKLIRRNAIANFELTDSYKEFIKYYNEKDKDEKNIDDKEREQK